MIKWNIKIKMNSAMRDATITFNFIFIDCWNFKWDIQQRKNRKIYTVNFKIKKTNFFCFHFGKTCSNVSFTKTPETFVVIC